jgi:hypothetical protein
MVKEGGIGEKIVVGKRDGCRTKIFAFLNLS